MSYTEIYKFGKNGDAETLGEVRNAHRGAMAVWLHMASKYLPTFIRTWGEDGFKDVWELAENPNVSETDQICLISTFDWVIVERSDIPKLLQAFRDFDGETSLKEQADLIEAAINEDTDIQAIAWNQTSVNSDAWESARTTEA